MKNSGLTCKFSKKCFAHYEIYMWTLRLLYQYDKQKGRIQPLNENRLETDRTNECNHLLQKKTDRKRILTSTKEVKDRNKNTRQNKSSFLFAFSVHQ